jgi:hypothetical protein
LELKDEGKLWKIGLIKALFLFYYFVQTLI